MRFHHSTRRGRCANRNASLQAGGGRLATGPLANKLNYDRETNIHFHRRLAIDPPDSHSTETPLNLEGSLLGLSLDSDNNLSVEINSSNSNNQRQPQENQEALDLEVARARLLAQVEKHPLWSSKAARRMQLTGAEQRRIYLYELVSFCERRELEWRYEPYKGARLGAQLPLCVLGPPSSPTSALTGTSTSTTNTPLYQHNNSSLSIRPQSACAGSLNSAEHRLVRQTSFEHNHQVMQRSISGSSTRQNNQDSPLATTSSSVMSFGERGREQPSAEQVWAAEPPGSSGGAKREPFVGYKLSAEVAHSSFVKRCHGCQGRGRLKCPSCFGVGYEVCFSCTGRGTTRGSSYLSAVSSSVSSAGANRCRSSDSLEQSKGGGLFAESSSGSRRDEPGGITSSDGGGAGQGNQSSWLATDACGFCHGAGQKRCWSCAGKGHSHCLACLGASQIRCYLAINFIWLNHRDELVLNNGDSIMARDRLRLAPSLCLLDQSAARLRPLARPQADGATAGVRPEDAQQVRAASRRLIERHSQLERRERVLQQRQRLHRVDCHIVHYEWKQRRGHFVLYDQQRKVYIAKYPFRSFCNIT